MRAARSCWPELHAQRPLIKGTFTLIQAESLYTRCARVSRSNDQVKAIQKLEPPAWSLLVPPPHRCPSGVILQYSRREVRTGETPGQEKGIQLGKRTTCSDLDQKIGGKRREWCAVQSHLTVQCERDGERRSLAPTVSTNILHVLLGIDLFFKTNRGKNRGNLVRVPSRELKFQGSNHATPS